MIYMIYLESTRVLTISGGFNRAASAAVGGALTDAGTLDTCRWITFSNGNGETQRVERGFIEEVTRSYRRSDERL